MDHEEIEDFWSKRDAKAIRTKRGCYVFALRAGRGYTPWYVGKATNSFLNECFQPHKTGKYNKVLFEAKKGTPVMFFVVLPTKKGPVPKEKIAEVEKFLIEQALLKNRDLENIANTRSIPDWGIEGVLKGTKGKPSKSAVKFRRVMGL